MHPYETVTADDDPRSTLRSLLNDFKVVVARKAFCLTVYFFAVEPWAVL